MYPKFEKGVKKMKINDCIWETDKLFYKHVTSESPKREDHCLHTHNVYELLYIVDGDVTHVIEDRKYKLKKGDLIIIRPLHYHYIQIDSSQNYERYNILFDPEKHNVQSVNLIPDNIEIINLSGNKAAEDTFQRFDFYAKSCPYETFLKFIPHMLSELFLNLSIFPQKNSEENFTSSPLITDALRYINQNLFTVQSVEEIAKHLFVSESYLFRLFKSELHQTPKKYIMDKRLLCAQKMIANGERPVTVCDTCGFGDYTTFYRNYSAFFGHSPSDEKRTNQQS